MDASLLPPELDFMKPIPTVVCCFEFEFLVAKKIPSVQYSHPSGSTDDSLPHQYWACPADEKDPDRAILNKCKDLLIETQQPVIICYDPSCPDTETRRFDADWSGNWDRFHCWHLEPSATARATNDSPADYDWFGVRLRCPFHSVVNRLHDHTLVKRILATLRAGLILHVNSSCRFNVQSQVYGDPMSLLTAKKLVTLVWLVEKELLLRVCPSAQGVPFSHVKPIDTHSRISTIVWSEQEDARSEDPLRAGIMDQHLPQLRDKVLQEKLHFLWGLGSIEEIAKALTCIDGQPTSFALRLNYKGGPTAAEFRYALWHPYGQRDPNSHLDTSKYWGHVASKFVLAARLSSSNFKILVKDVDSIIKGFASNSVPASSRWVILLDKLGLPENWSTPWGKIIDEYKTGRQLAHPNIDKHGLLGQIPEFKKDEPPQ